MPCRGPDHECPPSFKAELDKTTRILCDLLRNFPEAVERLSSEGREWWRNHQKIDADRKGR